MALAKVPRRRSKKFAKQGKRGGTPYAETGQKIKGKCSRRRGCEYLGEKKAPRKMHQEKKGESTKMQFFSTV